MGKERGWGRRRRRRVLSDDETHGSMIMTKPLIAVTHQAHFLRDDMASTISYRINETFICGLS